MKKIYILINGTKIEKDNFIKKFLNEAKEIASCSKFIKKHIPEELLNFYIK